jgi:hypothetical protein
MCQRVAGQQTIVAEYRFRPAFERFGDPLRLSCLRLKLMEAALAHTKLAAEYVFCEEEISIRQTLIRVDP